MSSWGEERRAFAADERGVTVQIGAVLLFGILVVALATVQVTVVPNENADAEFDHSLTVQRQMADLRNGLLGAAGTGDPHPTSVALGTRYPDRVVFVNPPPPSGSLATVGVGDPRFNVTLRNAGVDSEYENAREYWASAPDAGTFSTGTLVYSPDYNEYENAPTVVYENGLLVDRFDGGEAMARTGQTLVSGNVINLVALRGSLSASRQGSYTVDARSVSEAETTVTVRGSADEPLVLGVTSTLPATTWESSILAEQAAVVDVRETATWTAGGHSYHRVAVEFAPGVYELRAGSVGVGALTDDEATPDPAYLVAVDGYEPVANGTNGTATVAVRDRFNNPRSDARVEVSLDADHLRVWNGSAWSETATLRTGADGRATVRYRAVNRTGPGESAWLNVSMAGANRSYEYRNFTALSVPVVADGDGDADDVNPGEPGDVLLQGVSEGGDTYEMTFENGGDEARTIAYARINVFIVQRQGDDGGGAEPTSGDLYRVGSPAEATRLDVGGRYEAVDPGIELAAGASTDLAVEFDRTPTNDDSWFVLTVVFEDGEKATYFVADGG